MEHLAYLAEVLRQGGHTISGFTCDAAVEHCYSRDLRGRSRMRQCPECIIGGIRSYSIPHVWSIDPRWHEPLDSERFRRLTSSSVTTILRTEPTSDLASAEFRAALRNIEVPVATVYANAKRWIEESRLDAVLLFNGRMDLAAALRAACEDLRCPYIAVERSWFGHGLQLVPNECCISLREIGRLSEEFCERPLLPEQAGYAGRVAADRFRQRNTLEWRLYNPEAPHLGWPNSVPPGERVLILPSSRNEFEGHPDYECRWADHTLAMGAVLARLGLCPGNCVVRCHPNWAEPIGSNTGWRSERHWGSWAEKQGMTVIRSAERPNTYGLIGEADYVLVNGSTAGVDAALRGRKVICVGRATYERAGFSTQVHGPDRLFLLDTLETHDAQRTARLALRYLYTHGRRFVQFFKYVRAVTTLHYEYFAGANPQRIVEICRSGRLEPDDGRYGQNPEVETRVVNRVLAGDWGALGQWQEEVPVAPRMSVTRRFGWRWVDRVRGAFTRGDL